jgi:uncharacterized protein (TIGR03083 family)
MRYLTYRKGLKNRLGSLQDNYIVDVGVVTGFSDMLDLIHAGKTVWGEVAAKLKEVNVNEAAEKGYAIPVETGLIVTPIAKPPKNVICLGRNYYKHFLEGAVHRGDTAEKPPEAPVYFTKPHTAIIGPYDAVPIDPDVSLKIDWEAEMGVIIGIGGRKISKENANSHIFGYTVINDISARDLQTRHLQWFRGKGFDYSCPIGPVVVTPDELPDPVHIPIKLVLNGVVEQSANTGQLMFDIPTIIADISTSMTLEPGDIFSTGTPDGVGGFRNPPVFLQPGDMMETVIEGIGTLRNPITTVRRVELVERYNHERDNLLELIGQLKPEHYDLATECEGWTVKDLVAHLTNSAAGVQMLMQRQLDKVPNAGKAALDERNAKGVESRKDRTVDSMVNELAENHAKNIAFFLSLSEEQLKVEGTMASGEVVTVEERFYRAAGHYREHGETLARATKLKYER